MTTTVTHGGANNMPDWTAATSIHEYRVYQRLIRQCPECARVFDLLNPTDAQEWAYGHDCEDK